MERSLVSYVRQWDGSNRYTYRYVGLYIYSFIHYTGIWLSLSIGIDINRYTYLLVGGSIGRSVGRPVGRSAGRSVSRSVRDESAFVSHQGTADVYVHRRV